MDTQLLEDIADIEGMEPAPDIVEYATAARAVFRDLASVARAAADFIAWWDEDTVARVDDDRAVDAVRRMRLALQVPQR